MQVLHCTDLTQETCATVHHADCKAPTRQHELDNTGQESSICPVVSRSYEVGIGDLSDVLLSPDALSLDTLNEVASSCAH